MGQTQPQTTSNQQEQPEQDAITQINHPKFTNFKIIKVKDEEKVIEISLPIANESQYKRWVEKLKNAPTKSEINLFPLEHSYKKEGYCGSSGFATIKYDNYPFVLVDEIENRSKLQKKFFDEHELWYLIYTLLAAGTQFHTKGLKIGDIRPENIFINSDGQVKVGNVFSWPSQEDNYFKTFYEKQTTYLAPEQIKDLQFAKEETASDSVKAQAFSVGLTCLDASTLTHSKQFYTKNNRFDYGKLESRLTELREIGYNPLISRVIQNLCDLDPFKRCTCEQLFTWLNPYEESIINLQPFQPSQLLVKLIPPNKTHYLSQQAQSQHRYSQTIHSTVTRPLVVQQVQLPRKPQEEIFVRKIETSQAPIQYQVYPELKGEIVTSERREVIKEQKINYSNENQAKSKIDFDLGKIDEQLQMSRKMFPS